MDGMNRITGQWLTGEAHLRQSIVDILTTPLGSRVMRRDYGSRLYQWVDAPMNRKTLVEIYAVAAEALRRWEPRLEVSRIQVEQIASGRLHLLLEGEYRPSGRPIRLEGIEV